MEVLIKRDPPFTKTHAIGKCESVDGCKSIIREAKDVLPSWSERFVASYGYGGTVSCPICDKLVYMYPYASSKARELLKEVVAEDYQKGIQKLQ